MDYFKVTGGIPLSGEITVSGAKNAVLPILCATLLGDSPSILRNVPRVRDLFTLLKILEALGARYAFLEPDTIMIDPRGVNSFEAPYEMVKQMRASVCVLGPLFARHGYAKVSIPGGCVIGPRPIDIHLKGLHSLGARCTIEHGNVILKGAVRGAEVFLGGRFGPSVTATANILMAATLARGTVVIESASMEPEIQDLAHFLNRMGARISGIGSHQLEIEGVRRLEGAEYSVIPDRIEAGTFIIAAAMTRGNLVVKRARLDHLRALVDKLEAAGIRIRETESGLHVASRKRPNAVDVITLPFPGFPTDLQAQMMAMLSLSRGISVITEKIYPERFMHISELNRMGARISLEGATAVIKGVSNLSGAPVMASDLRASAALVLAALVAEGESVIDRVYHIDRGYEHIEQKLSNAGARIRRLSR
jgi:UDP-N-acetylglucosamine 1-carboxyvinyltransferase